MLIIECGKPWIKPGKFTTIMAGKKFKRIWFGPFAVTWTQFHQKELHDYIAEGNTTWLGAGNE